MLAEVSYLKNTCIAIYSSHFTMNISLRQLRVFVAVAEALSFTRAGDALGLPQSASARSCASWRMFWGCACSIATPACCG